MNDSKPNKIEYDRLKGIVKNTKITLRNIEDYIKMCHTDIAALEREFANNPNGSLNQTVILLADIIINLEFMNYITDSNGDDIKAINDAYDYLYKTYCME